ncbi:MAG: CarD family transcriptional regulator [Firmicutes bacterium]|nr:CarD family transcriptional regulator [Bacillota bacterium]
MYKIGDVVVYGTEGLCKICDITEKTFGRENIEYYVLTPVGKTEETVYVPKNNEKVLARMRHVLTMAEADALLEEGPDQEKEWEPVDRERQKIYKGILLCGSSRDVLAMTRTIYLHQLRQQEKGKKLHAADERFMHDAEKMLFEELAYVYKIPVAEVLPMIISKKGTL